MTMTAFEEPHLDGFACDAANRMGGPVWDKGAITLTILRLRAYGVQM
jgi:hypothetical protein